MQVLGAGLSKTGTTSLQRALGVLGLRTLHYDDRRLDDVLDGSTAEASFRRYDDVDAVLDIPAACFYRELLAAYPAAKCILTVRDEDAWWRSIAAHFNEKRPLERLEDDPVRWRIRMLAFGAARAEESSFRARYRAHNTAVRAQVPPERLLVMDVTAGDGWEVLCPFLGCTVPPLGFPHQNPRDEEAPAYRALALRELDALLPPGAPFVLVDEHVLAGVADIGRLAWPFVERDGIDQGLPADDESAIRELERQRERGASFLVLAWPALWWLEHYPGLGRHLRAHYRRASTSNRLAAFDLRGYP